ncbi:MAG: hypothetical protein P8L85_18020 [Rubripirellula sp.]|nr:hypothetical protein [Rubripirellula sp.]
MPSPHGITFDDAGSKTMMRQAGESTTIQPKADNCGGGIYFGRNIDRIG